MTTQAIRRMDVEVAQWVIHHWDRTGAFLPDQVILAYHQTPRSAGKDLFMLRWHRRKLSVPGNRLFDKFGVPDGIGTKYGDPEAMAYGVVATFANSAAVASKAPIEVVTQYKIASSVIHELVCGSPCLKCRTYGCRHCDGLGTLPWTDSKRRKEIDTTVSRWSAALGNIHRETLVGTVVAQRHAAMAYANTLRTMFPRRWANLLSAAAHKR